MDAQASIHLIAGAFLASLLFVKILDDHMHDKRWRRRLNGGDAKSEPKARDVSEGRDHTSEPTEPSLVDRVCEWVERLTHIALMIALGTLHWVAPVQHVT